MRNSRPALFLGIFALLVLGLLMNACGGDNCDSLCDELGACYGVEYETLCDIACTDSDEAFTDAEYQCVMNNCVVGCPTYADVNAALACAWNNCGVSVD